MKIIIVGATGTIGKILTEELRKRHEVIAAASKSGRWNSSSTCGCSRVARTGRPNGSVC